MQIDDTSKFALFGAARNNKRNQAREAVFLLGN